jgi:hypothetical protein
LSCGKTAVVIDPSGITILTPGDVNAKCASLNHLAPHRASVRRNLNYHLKQPVWRAPADEDIVTIAECLNARQDEYRYLLIDPLKSVMSWNPLHLIA